MKKKLKYDHSIGKVSTLFPDACATCHYKTRSKQCAWFEYTTRRDKILEAKAGGASTCPLWEKKETLNKVYKLRKDLERAFGMGPTHHTSGGFSR